MPARLVHLVPRAERSWHRAQGPATTSISRAPQGDFWGKVEGGRDGGTQRPGAVPPHLQEKVTKEVSQAPSPLPPSSHHNALPCSILEVLLHNRGAQSLSFSCCHNILSGAPQNGPVSSRTKPAAQPGWFWGVQGLAQTRATSLSVSHQRQSYAFGVPQDIPGGEDPSFCPHLHLSPLIPWSRWPQFLGRVWGRSYLQGCRVSEGLQGLQGLQGLSSVGLWLLTDKLQGKTCRRGVTG